MPPFTPTLRWFPISHPLPGTLQLLYSQARRVQEFPAFRRNRPVFLRPNHQNADPRIGLGDIGVQSRPRVLISVKPDTEKSQTTALPPHEVAG